MYSRETGRGLVPQARLISQARLTVDLGALYAVDLGGPF